MAKTKQKNTQKPVSLEDANTAAQANIGQTTSREEVIKILAANRGQAMTPEAIATAIGGNADKDRIRREVFQKSLGLAKGRNGVVEVDCDGGKAWVHLTKSDGRNAYTLTKVGVSLP